MKNNSKDNLLTIILAPKMLDNISSVRELTWLNDIPRERSRRVKLIENFRCNAKLKLYYK